MFPVTIMIGVTEIKTDAMISNIPTDDAGWIVLAQIICDELVHKCEDKEGARIDISESL